MILRLQRLSLIAACLSVSGFFLALTFLLWRTPNLLLHVDGTLTRTEAVLSKARATLDNLDKGTKQWADASKEQSDAITDVTTQAGVTFSTATGTLAEIRGTTAKLNTSADALTGLLVAGKGTTDAATEQIIRNGDSLTLAINQGKETAALLSKAVNDFDALITSPDLSAAITHGNETAENIAGVTLDFKKVSDKATADYLKPVPWWKWPLKRGGQMIDIGAALARHTP
jgi:ABC-type transporter Mla subunit MlaD